MNQNDLNYTKNLSKEKDYLEKSSEWKKWSFTFNKYNKTTPVNNFPEPILNLIESINFKKGADIHSPYGFAIVYNIYVNDYTKYEAESFVKFVKILGYIVSRKDRKVGL